MTEVYRQGQESFSSHNPSLVPKHPPIRQILRYHTLTSERQLSEADHQLSPTADDKNAFNHDLHSSPI